MLTDVSTRTKKTRAPFRETFIIIIIIIFFFVFIIILFIFLLSLSCLKAVAMDTKVLYLKLLLYQTSKHDEKGSEMLESSIVCSKCFGQIRFVHFEPCVLPAKADVSMHVFVDKNSRNKNSSVPINAVISIVVSIFHFGIWKGCFAMVFIFLTLTRIL